MCLYTRRRISIPPEGTVGRLRYALGGDRPSQTAHQPLFPPPLQGYGLAAPHAKGGISTTPPPTPEPGVPRLPPILRMPRTTATAGYSKAPRGLFVPSWSGRVFTASTISPGSSLRQRPSRYAFRAGRNLPDKEFRYLRTVIVTAAVYRGFGSALARLPLTFRHRAGVTPYTAPCGLAGSCVFGKQSLGPAPAPPACFTG